LVPELPEPDRALTVRKDNFFPKPGSDFFGLLSSRKVGYSGSIIEALLPRPNPVRKAASTKAILMVVVVGLERSHTVAKAPIIRRGRPPGIDLTKLHKFSFSIFEQFSNQKQHITKLSEYEGD
jgi:hypothetical protein